MDLHAVLRQSDTITIVGCSDNPYRASNLAAASLSEAGYTVIPVNPKYALVNGIACYADYDEIPDDVSIDVVNIFRNPAETYGALQSIIKRSLRTGRKPIVWTQPGVSSVEAQTIAEAAGLPYIRDRCIMTELARMIHNGS